MVEFLVFFVRVRKKKLNICYNFLLNFKMVSLELLFINMGKKPF